MGWIEPNTIAPALRSRLQRLFPLFTWEIAHIDNLAETVEMRGGFRLNGRRCSVRLVCNHEWFHESPGTDDMIKHYIARAVAQIVVKG